MSNEKIKIVKPRRPRKSAGVVKIKNCRYQLLSPHLIDMGASGQLISAFLILFVSSAPSAAWEGFWLTLQVVI